ncbi:MAG: hypothetical protein SFU25_11705 [Candidatus Caenarcaniphilales bacterium]|nr:hypothetical protein [Candidatus Caenarcaniphilales bacterium]
MENVIEINLDNIEASEEEKVVLREKLEKASEVLKQLSQKNFQLTEKDKEDIKQSILESINQS